MKSFVACLVLLASSGLCLAAPASEDKDERSLSLFTVVNFENTDCDTTDGQKGKCYNTEECTAKGGTTSGNCASGFGVCCVVTLAACGGDVTHNSTYVANEGFTTTSTTGVTTAVTCEYKVKYLNTDICQLRLEFQTFELKVAGEGNLANAATDTFAATSPSGSSPPRITGLNSARHMYVETSRSTTEPTLTFNIKAGAAARWNVRVDQIECSNTNKAPAGCTQYFTAATGTVNSYNFRTMGTVNELTEQSTTICIRQGANSCTVQYTAASDTSFIVGATDADAEVNTCAIAALYIPRVEGTFGSGSVCQGTFSGTQDSTVDSAVIQRAPFILTHKTPTNDAGTDYTAALSGFRLDYSQLGC